MHELMPALGVRHYSERMSCPKCGERGMFIWSLSVEDPEPVSGGSQYQINAWENGVLVATLCRASEFELAIAAFDVAVKVHQGKQITLQERARVLRDSYVKDAG
ncbi:hypothetical protein [Maritalea porphyrae]|uniref:hypothetical protein n=1 Tax=Maritalea porphyrae TaxID=880732 RepID=UPI0022AF2629|nr:hypothetical protein [Maritalea porphyrae]MCZ4272478.1 hypothetical protein [Maritalea porphyrae]